MVQEDGDGHGPQRHALHRRRSEEQEPSAVTLREETGEISEEPKLRQTISQLNNTAGRNSQVVINPNSFTHGSRIRMGVSTAKYDRIIATQTFNRNGETAFLKT